ncbi:MAG: PTS lactose/cellobiose transporter subunit IIA [Atopobiaceae bacterium]|jgi:PTS system cellobiose-specific IIA component|nr:PTS lactose/cellobiose transporter subunit IIA [Atopobiaceae bacterium]MCI2172873.1 PTS lactose/cellobiose transporter subunit IIA [Atopobiaceae bacterium]MCI2207180.1 PTS lactose/cellobiose transporter subunit IIA [Atopobiaceae bacterium]
MADMTEEELVSTCFEIIGYVGAAKSSYIEAINKAKDHDFEAAQKMIEEGNENYGKGHQTHTTMLQQDAAGEKKATFALILIHAEDQMMSAETFRILAQDFIDVYKQIDEK